ncbi:MAG: Uncharacterized protein G01um101456_292, partial [Parcubacteria group bacterium Gr01-1014_56]
RNNVVSSGSPNTTGWGVVGPLTRALIIQTWKSISGPSTPTQPTPGSGGGSSGSTPTITPSPGGGGGGSSGGGSSGGGGGGSSVSAPAPTVSLSVSSSTIFSGDSTAITWVATNANACSASGGWSGTRAPNGTQTLLPTASATYTITCTGPGGTTNQSTTITVSTPTQPTPTVSLISSPSSLTSGQSATLTWSSANATSCTASNGWTGTKATSGTQSVTPTATASYTITCTGAGGSASQSTTISVSVSSTPLPTITLSPAPASVLSGQSSTLAWSATNATSCTASGGAFTGTKAVSGTQVLSNLTSTQLYTLTCTGSGGSASQSTTVTVSAPPPSAPTVTLLASPTSVVSGQSATLTWSSANATSCTASNGWTGTKATSGTQTLSPTATQTYTITCTGAGGSANQSTTITVTQPVPTVTFSASPTSIVSGQSSTLTWSSTNAASCTASNGWTGTKTISGTQSVSPTANTTYTLTCTGSGGNAGQSTTVTVTSTAPPPPPPASGFQRAFPTAEGYGQYAVGGRGGAVIEVTNLNDSGTGSFRACATAAGPRTCIFKVSGDIVLDTAIEVKNPYLTIAGQTSPDGINIKVGPNLKLTPLYILAPHVIVRHMHFRPGRGANTGATGAANALDAISMFPPAHNVIFDHLSISWATDEAINVYGPNVTVQWSFWYETLKNHSKGSVMTGAGQTYHHNLTAHNVLRNPDFTGGYIDFINNIQYNGGQRNGEFYNRRNLLSLNFVGNLGIMGGNTASGIASNDFFSYESTDLNPIAFYMRDNLDWYRTSSAMAQDIGVDPADKKWMKSTVQSGGLSVADSNITEARQAALDTLAFGGATVPRRDTADARVVTSVRSCGGSVITEPSEVGGFPIYDQSINAPLDSDQDGMPNTWETSKGLNPNNASDRNGDLDGDGYTNVEEYLNELAGDQDANGALISRIGMGTGSLPADLSCGRSVPTPLPSSPVITFKGSAPGISPSEALTVPPGTAITLDWTVTGAQACTFDIFDRTGNTNVTIGFSGSLVYTPLYATEYKISCSSGARISNSAIGVSLTNDPYYVDGADGAPTLSLNTTPANISSGQSSTISWSSSAVACVPIHLPYANGLSMKPWSLSSSPSGSAQVSPFTTTAYLLSCVGTEGAQITTRPAVVTIGGVPVPPPTPAPTVSLSASPISITSGQSASLTWSSTNATSCSASGGWSGAQGTSGTQSVSPTTNTTYTLTCSGGGGSTSQSTTVLVTTTSPPTSASVPTVSFSASPTSITSGQSSTLTWGSTDATSCSASGGWSGAQGTSGTQSISPTANTTYTLTCTGAGGSANQSSTVTVTSSAPPPSGSIQIGSRVETTAGINVRSGPGSAGTTILGSQQTGALGTVIDGPQTVSGGIWWNINFDTKADGWAISNYLRLAPTVQLPVPLKYGIVSEWVAYLQHLLNQDPDTQVAAVGAGSQGNETNYFGNATRRAVQAFQQKYDVATSGNPGYGIVGPRTTEKLKQIFGF